MRRNPRSATPKNMHGQRSSKGSSGGNLGQIRIIGGDWRGRKLPVLAAEGLRPSSDRVRETLFNWLQFDVPGARCLDVFAGSGALGFEALSRGAKLCQFIELNADNAKQLKANLVTLQVQSATVEQADSLQWLAKPADEAFDVVFLDPPFNKGLMQPSIDRLFQQGWVNTNSWIYIEQEKSLEWPELPEGWRCHREKTTSQVRFGLFCYQQ